MLKLIKELKKKGKIVLAKKVKKVMAEGWEDLPKGWTKDSARKFWDSLTGDRKHKITQCMKKLEGTGIVDTGAFCSSLARLVGYEE